VREKLNTLFIYIDESGNFDFTTKGTRHLVFGVFTTNQPLENSAQLAKLKYELLTKGIDIANFHASEDLRVVRDRVFEIINSNSSCRAISMWLDKQDLDSTEFGAIGVYKILGNQISKYIGDIALASGTQKLVIIFDKALTRKDQNAVFSALKPNFSVLGLPYHLYFHHVTKDFNGQIADYLAWARFISLERGEVRPLSTLPDNLSGEIRIFSSFT